MTKIYYERCPRCGKKMTLFTNPEIQSPRYWCGCTKKTPTDHGWGVYLNEAELINTEGVEKITIKISKEYDYCLDQIASKSFGMSKEEIVCAILKKYIKENGTERVYK